MSRAAVATLALSSAAVVVADPATGRPVAIREVVAAGATANELAGVSWTAFVDTKVTGRLRPRRDAPPGFVLRPLAPYSGSAAGFLVVAADRSADGAAWLRVQVPRRPNGSAVWIPVRAVSLVPTRLRVVVHLRTRTIELLSGTRVIRSAPAGIGRPGTPTPRGRFAVEDLVPTVTPADRAMYGRFVITLTAHSTALRRFNGGVGQVAIHGTREPARVGRPSSYGCVVLDDRTLLDFWRLLDPGVPVVVTD